MADGFSSKLPYSENDVQEMGKWLEGWGVASLDTHEQFRQYLDISGFSDISYRNVTANVMPSSKRLYGISFPALFFSKIGEWMGMRTKRQTNNIWAAYYQYKTLKKGLWEYGIFKASK